MADLFKDIVPSILQTKKDVLLDEGDYVSFVVNRALSHHYDCIMQANQMNMVPHTDRKLQYHYFLNSIRPYKRPFQKWQKREVTENLNILKEYYQCSNEKAKEILSVLHDDQINAIKKKIDKGGLNVEHKRISRGKTSGT